MTNQAKIASDALFMVLYIGFAGAMACLSLTLVITYLMDFHLSVPHAPMTAVNIAGWALIPLAQKAYQPLTGEAFTWRSNAVLDGGTEL